MKLGATRVTNDVKLAVAAGADVVVVDGMQGGTGATPTTFIEHTGIPHCQQYASPPRRCAKSGKQHEVQLIVSGGIRSGADVAKALALGANRQSRSAWRPWSPSVATGQLTVETAETTTPRPGTRLRTAAGFCHHCHTGRCPVGVTTQDQDLESRLDPLVGALLGGRHLKGNDDGTDSPGPGVREIQCP